MTETDDTTLYLTTLRCENGHEDTYAHEGPTTLLDQSPPTPDVDYCPVCMSRYEHDRDIVEVTEGKRRESGGTDTNELYERAIELWGEDLQRDLAVEEMAEAIIANQHRKRGRATREELIEEFADVMILMEQMQVTYGPQFDEMYDHKLSRLEDRIEQAERGGTDEIGGDDE